MPAVSIIIALYNKRNYIEACIQSVLNQTYGDFELIVVDDESTDGSLSLVENISDERLILIHQKNAGPGAARNKGVALAKAPYITFLDADDTWDLNFLSVVNASLTSDKEMDLFLCGARWEPLGEKRLPVLQKEKHVAQSGKWLLPSDLNAQELYEVMNFFATGAVVIKKKVFDRYGGFFDKVKCTSGEDAYLWIQVMFNHVIHRELDFYLNVNTEGSDLGIGRKQMKPIPPSVLFPGPIRKHCPPDRLISLNHLLDYIAFRAFRREIYQFHYWNAIKLLFFFPKLGQEKTDEYPPVYLSFILIPLKKYIGKIKHRFFIKS